MGRRSAWDDGALAVLATGPHVPVESLLFMGCGHWTPEREGRTSPAQKHPDPHDCPVCGDPMLLYDPIDSFTTVVAVCGRCVRSNYEGLLPGRVGPGRDGYDTDRADQSRRTEVAVLRPLQSEPREVKPPTRKQLRAAKFVTRGSPPPLTASPSV